MSADDVARVFAIEDKVERLKAATDGVAAAQQTINELTRIRRAVIRELHAEGWTFARIGAAAGLSRARIHQVSTQGPAPEGLFFGHGALTVLTPRVRTGRLIGAPDPAAATRLAELLRQLGFAVTVEQFPPGHPIDLNRDGLIVLGGPELSPSLRQLIAADPRLRRSVARAGDGRRGIEDRAARRVYRPSGPDPHDIAYLARLPRPDGQGSILVIDGLHPPGSLGAVRLLATRLAGLHERAGTRRFSVLIAVRFDRATGEPLEAELLTPVYRHEPAEVRPTALRTRR
ncbi:hypothetical protein IU485_09960 [Nocardia cyriacigeorgica]|uniref:Sigma-70 family RNA polymerase sigma factor n=1 Tax=Nocardia cyriacigeorgica (strain GUH-2) TaxID=1127134 RepID=H6RDI2_NOCCG|nr:hypothetical protein [Nocardia cyriacigeorgica]MBF6081683.1 hypothetical protein [Nocardia cyriacigeorgica]MBF6285852.1 hypothetical protein [Nocardia cyriacigeorgica]MBF6424501.1 hypothetical protein [Nocardia cyriacigeorgica]CCF65233.1 conserved protein of unknown function, putative RNA polymerase sigma factor domain [Nocardia cyriacigeorgica GUH-2]BDU08299.1 hypothetical protein FMUBM48_45620 [Nocardia cyriacigeorgica]